MLLNELGISKKYILAGNSWGGILALDHALAKPKGFKGLIISNSLASVPQWIPEIERLISELPSAHRKAIKKAIKEANYKTPEFEAANNYFTAQHLIRVPFTADVIAGFTASGENPTVYHAMWGPAEFSPIGSLRTWDIEKQLDKFKVPTLLINGKHDEVTPKTQRRLVKKIKGAEWVCLPHSSHLAWLEESAAWFLKAEENLTQFHQLV
ncbi:MAG: alpha/beta fold hydrolase [Candidatus Nanopelagicus sp.]